MGVLVNRRLFGVREVDVSAGVGARALDFEEAFRRSGDLAERGAGHVVKRVHGTGEARATDASVMKTVFCSAQQFGLINVFVTNLLERLGLTLRGTTSVISGLTLWFAPIVLWGPAPCRRGRSRAATRHCPYSRREEQRPSDTPMTYLAELEISSMNFPFLHESVKSQFHSIGNRDDDPVHTWGIPTMRSEGSVTCSPGPQIFVKLM